ncbi:MAG: glutamine synthetase type III, partial [Planctomycetales bacterium]|nr:glutamine synthetase type III [Planctomycetales bacterium]
PFAFTGNRFEFRAVGSNFSIAGPLVAMNTIIAESLDFCASQLEAATGGDAEKLHGAVQTLLSEIINDCGDIIFNGNGYSEEWHAEAKKRGLKNLKTTADALPELLTDEVKKLFSTYEVLSERELESRYETYCEQYCMTVNVESNLTKQIARKMIFPAAIRYQNELAATCTNLQALGYEFDTDTLDRITQLVKALQDAIAELAAATKEGCEEVQKCCDQVLPAMLQVRACADELEGLVADDLWPLPTYQEMLFIK